MSPSKIILFVIVLASSNATAQRTPPIGKRSYLIDAQGRSGPTRILPDSYSRGRILRDPVQPGSPIPINLSIPSEKPRQIAKSSSVKVRFKNLKVKGYLTNPAVGFSMESFSLDRVDEPLQADFFEKVFLPAQDNRY